MEVKITTKAEYTFKFLGRYADFLLNCDEKMVFSQTDTGKAAENKEDRRAGKQQIDADTPHGS